LANFPGDARGGRTFPSVGGIGGSEETKTHSRSHEGVKKKEKGSREISEKDRTVISKKNALKGRKSDWRNKNEKRSGGIVEKETKERRGRKAVHVRRQSWGGGKR